MVVVWIDLEVWFKRFCVHRRRRSVAESKVLYGLRRVDVVLKSGASRGAATSGATSENQSQRGLTVQRIKVLFDLTRFRRDLDEKLWKSNENRQFLCSNIRCSDVLASFPAFFANFFCLHSSCLWLIATVFLLYLLRLIVLSGPSLWTDLNLPAVRV